ncbi:MAG: thioesterase family protein [Oscillospiraceae bacterium]|nr:thioesterase family protein [Oscillospiraceae bacterium]
MEYVPYRRHAYYYETDQMAIIHHSNYIRWFEEARLDWMTQIGYNYREMEKTGVVIPVVDISAKYLISVRYDDDVDVTCRLVQFTGVRMVYEYEIRFLDGRVAVTGRSTHCFVTPEQAPLSIRRRLPEAYEKMKSLVEAPTM